MLRQSKYYCPECDEGFELPKMRSRRAFLAAMGAAAGVAAAGAPRGRAEEAKATPKPAEGLIRELHATLSEDQKKALIQPYDHGASEGRPTRQRTFNSAFNEKVIAENYTKPQRELVQRIVRSILASDEALERLSRKGTWDDSGSLEGCGAVMFGEPGDKAPYAFVFSGHHITLRCDGNSEPKTAWGGPIYYGHSEPGYSKNNVYHYQTEAVQAAFDALDEKQRAKAMPCRGLVAFRPPSPSPGLLVAMALARCFSSSESNAACTASVW